MPCNALKHKDSVQFVSNRERPTRVLSSHSVPWIPADILKIRKWSLKTQLCCALNNTALSTTVQSNWCNIFLKLAQHVNCWARFSLKITHFRCVSVFESFPTTLFNSLAAVCNFILPCMIQSMFQRAEKDQTGSLKLFLINQPYAKSFWHFWTIWIPCFSAHSWSSFLFSR